MDSGEFVDQPGKPAIQPRGCHFREEPWHPGIGHRMIQARGLMCEGTGQAGFSGAGLAGEDDLLMCLEPATLGEGQDLTAVKATGQGATGGGHAGQPERRHLLEGGMCQHCASFLVIIGNTRDFARYARNAIEMGDFPEWELGVQVFDDAFADSFDFDVLDATKIIPEELVPVRMIRAETFADHYSQARQFYISQIKIEQGHMADALIFELSKVVVPEIRKRLVAHLLHIEADLTNTVADGLGLDEVPKAHEPACEPINDLPASDALSILKNGPDSFAGRKRGILVTDGIDDAVLDGLKDAVSAAGGIVEIVAQKVGGVARLEAHTHRGAHFLRL